MKRGLCLPAAPPVCAPTARTNRHVKPAAINHVVVDLIDCLLLQTASLILMRKERRGGSGASVGIDSPARSSEWYNSHIRCGLASMRERVSASERIPGAALGLRKRERCSPGPIGSIG